MKDRRLVINPFVSEAQRRACYARDDPDWDCQEWSDATKERGKKLPDRKSQTHNARTAIGAAKKSLRKNRKISGSGAPNPLARSAGPRKATAQFVQGALAAYDEHRVHPTLYSQSAVDPASSLRLSGAREEFLRSLLSDGAVQHRIMTLGSVPANRAYAEGFMLATIRLTPMALPLAPVTHSNPDQPRDEKGRWASSGDRPPRPDGQWQSVEHIADHARAVASAHFADPHVASLMDALEDRKRFHAYSEKLYREASDDESRRKHGGAVVEAHQEIEKIQEALAHEGRRTLSLSFGLPPEDRAPRISALVLSRSNGTQAKNWQKVSDWIEDLSHKDGAGTQRIMIQSTRSRAYYSLATINTASKDDAGVTAHEFGHHLEEMPWVADRVQMFRKERFDSSDDAPMSKSFPRMGYGKDEVGNSDDMGKVFGEGHRAAYVGKTYDHRRTEIVSMGLEQLYRDPMHFARADPHYFSMMISILQGPRK